jgi:hypothetical protein
LYLTLRVPWDLITVLIKFGSNAAITPASPQLAHIDAWDVRTIVQRRD